MAFFLKRVIQGVSFCAFSLTGILPAYAEFSSESKLIEAGFTSTENQFGDRFASFYIRYDGPLINCELPVNWSKLDAVIIYFSKGQIKSRQVSMQVNCSIDGPPTYASYSENCYLDQSGLCPRDPLFNEWILARQESRPYAFQLAFVDGSGNWDSLWGQNYHIELQPR